MYTTHLLHHSSLPNDGIQVYRIAKTVVADHFGLIVVGVAIDTMRQLEAQLVMRNYEGFIK